MPVSRSSSERSLGRRGFVRLPKPQATCSRTIFCQLIREMESAGGPHVIESNSRAARSRSDPFHERPNRNRHADHGPTGIFEECTPAPATNFRSGPVFLVGQASENLPGIAGVSVIIGQSFCLWPTARDVRAGWHDAGSGLRERLVSSAFATGRIWRILESFFGEHPPRSGGGTGRLRPIGMRGTNPQSFMPLSRSEEHEDGRLGSAPPRVLKISPAKSAALGGKFDGNKMMCLGVSPCEA